MLKNTWTFEYTAAALVQAVDARLSYHDERLVFWRQRREATVAEIRADGIEVDEKIVLAYDTPKARDWRRGGEVMIRNDLRKALGECYEKLAWHTKRRDVFDGWRQVLAANPDKALALDMEDWLFFFGRDSETDDDE